jgi:hypothetical protein
MQRMIAPAFRVLVTLSLALLAAGCARRMGEPKVTTSSSATPKTAPTTSTTAAGKVSAPGTLFDGKTLTGWKVTDFAGHGAVTVTNGSILLGEGYMTGITWTNEVPRMNFEISLEAQRVDGTDFFCGLTFPVGEAPCSFIVGGWGGGVVGLSSINSEDASQNETTSYLNFTTGQWYKIRVRVEPDRISAWIDDDRVVNVETAGKEFSIRVEMYPSTPLGIATWNTAGAVRNIQVRKL